MKTIKGHRKMRVRLNSPSGPTVSVFIFLLIASFVFPLSLFPQKTFAQSQLTTAPAPLDQVFRLERVPVAGGAELITIKGRLAGLQSPVDDIEADKASGWVPLVTVLRDTLGDHTVENDRLRYVWPLTYTRPTLKQRVSSAIPFLYSRVGNKGHSSKQAPPPVLDLAATDRDVWNKIFWNALQSLLLDPYGTPVKAATRSYEHNIGAYRKSHIIRALSVLSLYQAVEGTPAFRFTKTTP